MNRSLFFALLCLGALVTGAIAAEVSVTGRLNEVVDGSNNYFLNKDPSGYTGRSLSALNLQTLTVTPTTRYLLNSNFSYYKYFGPGAKDTTLTWGTPMSETFSLDHTEPLTKYHFDTSWQRSDVATTSLQQTGTASGRGTIDTYAANGGITRQLSQLDTVSLSTHGSTVSYSDPGQTPYVDFSATTSWYHQLTQTTKLIQSVYFDWFFSDNDTNTQRLFWQLTSGVETQLTKRLSIIGSLGWVFVNAYQNATTPSFVSTITSATNSAPSNGGGFQPIIGASNGWMGNLVVKYKPRYDTDMSFVATRAVTPTIYGQLQGIESLGTTLNYKINRASALGFAAQFSHTKTAQANAAPTVSDFFTGSAIYSYQLNRDWNAKVSYTYRQKNDSSGLVRSNTGLVTLAYNFNLFGKPPVAVVKTPSELALEELRRAQYVFPSIAPY